MKLNRAEIIGSVTYLPFGPAQCRLSVHLFKNNHMQKQSNKAVGSYEEHHCPATKQTHTNSF